MIRSGSDKRDELLRKSSGRSESDMQLLYIAYIRNETRQLYFRDTSSVVHFK